MKRIVLCLCLGLVTPGCATLVNTLVELATYELDRQSTRKVSKKKRRGYHHRRCPPRHRRR